MTRWLVTGADGMLGTDLMAALSGRGELVTGMNRAALDVTDAEAVTGAIARSRPDVVVNCAAWTAVDDAEAAEERALAVNAGGAASLALGCAAAGARLVQLSTDYVFAGDASRPYAEDDAPAPRTAYGRTKLAGERAVLGQLPGSGYVVRTAWLYGAHGSNFVRTMIKLEDQRPVIDVVDDQHGQPTWTADVARQIIALIEAGAPPGVYHATSRGQTTWCGLAREIFSLLGADPDRVRPVTSSELTRPAPGRPTACSATTPGTGWVCRRSVTGGTPCGAPSPRSWPRRAPPPRPDQRPANRSGQRAPVSISGLRSASLRLRRLRLRGPAQAVEVGGAVGVRGQQPGPACLLQRRSRGVLRRKHRLDIVGPLDADGRVQRVHAVLTSRGVRSRAEIDDRRLLAEGGEGVSQAGLQEHGPPALPHPGGPPPSGRNRASRP